MDAAGAGLRVNDESRESLPRIQIVGFDQVKDDDARHAHGLAPSLLPFSWILHVGCFVLRRRGQSWFGASHKGCAGRRGVVGFGGGAGFDGGAVELNQRARSGASAKLSPYPDLLVTAAALWVTG